MWTRRSLQTWSRGRFRGRPVDGFGTAIVSFLSGPLAGQKKEQYYYHSTRTVQSSPRISEADSVDSTSVHTSAKWGDIWPKTFTYFRWKMDSSIREVQQTHSWLKGQFALSNGTTQKTFVISCQMHGMYHVIQLIYNCRRECVMKNLLVVQHLAMKLKKAVR